MASSSPDHRRPASRRQSTTSVTSRNLTARDATSDLSRSMKQMSLTTPSATNSPRSPKPPLSPFRQPLSRASPSPAPAPRIPSRSPSSHGRESRSATPTLLRKASTSSLRSVNGKTTQTPRRSSSAHIMSPASKSPLSGPSPGLPVFEERPVATANSVASEYFAADLAINHGPDSTCATDAIVILHDDCYGHRFSRPRTSRSALGTVVERPERIKAGVLGLAMAYVRLGERHAEGRYPIHPSLDPASIPTLPFRIRKTTRKLSLLSTTVSNVHGTKWMEELHIMCNAAESKLAMGGKELQRPEINRGPDAATPPKLHEGDLYLCSESLNSLEGALGAVCEAVDTVFGSGPRRSFVAVRPPGHHCSASYPSGFCWVNNVHVGIMHASMNHGLTHAAIIDLDLHHGDGSQSIAWQHNARGNGLYKNSAAWKRSSIGYFSLHDINSYPCEAGDEEKVKNASLCIENAHGQNVWNVHLQPWSSEAEFWKLYESKYSVLLEKTRSYLKRQTERCIAANQPPKAAIFISAGFDASEWESAGMQRHNVNVPTEFYARMSQDIVKVAAEEGTSVEGRIISVLEGGYSDRALFSGICSHLSGLAGDQLSEAEAPPFRNGLGAEMGARMGVAQPSSAAPHAPTNPYGSLHTYDSSWWSSPELDRIEIAVGPVAEPKAPRHATPPTYSSPTQSSTARALDPNRFRRSLSGVGHTYSRAPTPPPPEVPWEIAAFELSKLLIPTDRQTDSCKPEDLGAEATRVRRDRQSMLTQGDGPAAPMLPPPAPSRMALRERRGKPIGPIDEEDDDLPVASNRRKTVDPILETKTTSRGVTPAPQAVKRTSRRLSAASTISPSATETDELAPSPGAPVSRPIGVNGPRASTALGVRTQPATGAALTVKKPRASSVARKEPVRQARTTKKPAPSTTATTTTRPAPTKAPARPSRPSTSGTLVSSAVSSSDDIDSITTGMKKIKINLITKAQKEARQRESNGTVPSIRTPTDSNSPSSSSPPAVPQPTINGAENISPYQESPNGRQSSPENQATTPLHNNALPPPSPDPLKVPLPRSSRPSLDAKQSPLTSSSPDIFIPYQPEGPSPISLTPHAKLTFLPPNTSTPSPMKRADLPVFTATSAIPFSSRQVSNGEFQKMEERPGSVWDIPESPRKV